MIYDELIRILNTLLQKPVFKRFPALREKFNVVVVRFFQKCMVPTQKLCSDVIKYQHLTPAPKLATSTPDTPSSSPVIVPWQL
jgi:Dynamin central region